MPRKVKQKQKQKQKQSQTVIVNVGGRSRGGKKSKGSSKPSPPPMPPMPHYIPYPVPALRGPEPLVASQPSLVQLLEALRNVPVPAPAPAREAEPVPSPAPSIISSVATTPSRTPVPRVPPPIMIPTPYTPIKPISTKLSPGYSYADIHPIPSVPLSIAEGKEEMGPLRMAGAGEALIKPEEPIISMEPVIPASSSSSSSSASSSSSSAGEEKEAGTEPPTVKQREEEYRINLGKGLKADKMTTPEALYGSAFYNKARLETMATSLGLKMPYGRRWKDVQKKDIAKLIVENLQEFF